MGLHHLVNGAANDVAPDATAVPWRNASISLTEDSPISKLGTFAAVKGLSNAGDVITGLSDACAAVGTAFVDALAPYLPGGPDSRLYLNYLVRRWGLHTGAGPWGRTLGQSSMGSAGAAQHTGVLCHAELGCLRAAPRVGPTRRAWLASPTPARLIRGAPRHAPFPPAAAHPARLRVRLAGGVLR